MEHIDLKSLEKSFSTEGVSGARMLRSKINEQSSLISTLKQKAEETHQRCQSLQKSNADLEDKLKGFQKEVDKERKKAELLEARFMDLAANNASIIALMEEYKHQNAQLKVDNKRLQSENQTLFSQKLQEKDMAVEKLTEEINMLTVDYTNQENQYREKLAESQSTLVKQASEHLAKEASLCDKLHEAQRLHADVAQRCKDMKLQLQQAEEQHVTKEVDMKESIKRLTKEREVLQAISTERKKVIQDKQDEIQQLEIKYKEERRSRVKAEERFQHAVEAVDADMKVKSLKSSLQEATAKYEKLNKDLEAFKEHSNKLLQQERELNKKLCQMTG